MFTDPTVAQFYWDLINEMFIQAGQSRLSADYHGTSKKAAMISAFERIVDRMDLDRKVVARSSQSPPINQSGLEHSMLAIAFGNFLARKGIYLDEIMEDECKP